VTLAAGRYSDRDGAVQDYHNVWGARHAGELDHTALAVITKDDFGNVQVERHDSSAKHLAWGGALLGAALCVVAPPAGVAALAASAGAGAAAGGIIGHFWHNIPRADVTELGHLLEDGESGLLVVAVNRRGEDITPLMEHADRTFASNTTWGNLDTVVANAAAQAGAKQAGSAKQVATTS
jgi:hypothetical protein